MILVCSMVTPLAMLPRSAQSQQPGTTVTAAIQPNYAAGSFHRWLLGSDYRELWTTPITVQVLDLVTFAGGLTPTTALVDGVIHDLRNPDVPSERGLGRQTKSIRFRGRDGYEYGFRSIDKELDVLPPELQGTFVDNVLQDQTSSAHPAAAAVTTELAEVAGILHAAPRLVVLPDDPLLGRVRERLAGTIGFLERRMITGPDVQPFAGASEIIHGSEILPRLRAHPDERVDARSFLRARLFDMLIGDWDRHRDQWNWGRFGNGDAPTEWIAIPEDHDQAFVRYDGLMLALARVQELDLVKFDARYPNMVGLNWNGRELDRIILPTLSSADWDSMALNLQRRLSDAAIESAVARMPAEYLPLDSANLANRLKARRDALPEAARRYFRMLAGETDLYGTDVAEVATVVYGREGWIDVQVRERSESVPYLHRRFVKGETGQIRLHLLGGDDSVVVRGPGVGTDLRIVAGDGRDVLVDSARYRPTRLYTDDGDRAVARYGVRVDRRHYTQPRGRRGRPPRDWGSRRLGLPWMSYSPELGPFVGGQWELIDYGFRFRPYSSRVRVRGGYASAERTGAGGILGVFYLPNSRLRWEVEGDVSGLEIIRFHGIGNETPAPVGKKFHRVDQVHFGMSTDLILEFDERSEVGIGGVYRYHNTLSRPGTFLTDQFPNIYGQRRFWSLGVRGHVRLDFRNRPIAASRGAVVELGGTYYFPHFSVNRGAYGEVHGSAATYLSATSAPLRPTLALRIGGKKVFGTFPFFDAAFLGGSETVRLGRAQRFAGDAAAWGNAELRLRLGSMFVLLPGEFGIHGLADAGRVFVRGETSSTIHTAFGGGAWISVLAHSGTLSVSLAQSSERLGIYVQAGFGF